MVSKLFRGRRKPTKYCKKRYSVMQRMMLEEFVAMMNGALRNNCWRNDAVMLMVLVEVMVGMEVVEETHIASG